MKEKVVLAYSGGLDTTAIIPWLKENFDYEVICCCINCGQGEELDGLEERAKLSGASKLYIEDITDDFCENYIIPCVQAGAVYENKYLLGTAMARPGIAAALVKVARLEGATAICHGATGKGNDQIRFELGIKALAPDLKIIAPWRMTTSGLSTAAFLISSFACLKFSSTLPSFISICKHDIFIFKIHLSTSDKDDLPPLLYPQAFQTKKNGNIPFHTHRNRHPEHR